jgi:hypothetical protein
MSKQILISMLKQGSNGNEILSILDAIVSDSVSDADALSVDPTLEEIAF